MERNYERPETHATDADVVSAWVLAASVFLGLFVASAVLGTGTEVSETAAGGNAAARAEIGADGPAPVAAPRGAGRIMISHGEPPAGGTHPGW